MIVDGHVPYGVDDSKALILMTSGIRSCRLAQAIAADSPSASNPPASSFACTSRR